MGEKIALFANAEHAAGNHNKCAHPEAAFRRRYNGFYYTGGGAAAGGAFLCRGRRFFRKKGARSGDYYCGSGLR